MLNTEGIGKAAIALSKATKIMLKLFIKRKNDFKKIKLKHYFWANLNIPKPSLFSRGAFVFLLREGQLWPTQTYQYCRHWFWRCSRRKTV